MKCKAMFFLFCFIISYGHCELTDHLRVLDDKTCVRSIPYIDYIYVINLDHRPSKYQETLDELTPYGIVPYRFSAVNGWKLPIEVIWDVGLVFEKGMRSGGMGSVFRWDNGEEFSSHELVEEEGTQYFCHCGARGMVGCILSHLTVINDALHSGYDIIWICEDDIEVIHDPHVLSQCISDLDDIVGRDNWDVLFTFRDYRQSEGEYCISCGVNYRPNIDTSDQKKFAVNCSISSNLRQMGSRFGTQSMIWTKRGMEKVLNFYKQYKIFLPYDLDLALIPNIKIYSTTEDIVANKFDPLTDLGEDYYKADD